MSPRSARNVVQGDPTLHPSVFRAGPGVETDQRRENAHHMEKLLLEEALADLQRARPAPRVDTGPQNPECPIIPFNKD